MDIREAMAKIEELQRLVLMQKKDSAQNILVYNIPLAKVFTDSYSVSQKFECIKACGLSADITIDIDISFASQITISAYCNNVPAESISIGANNGKGQYTASFLIPVQNGVHTLKFEIVCGAGITSTINGACIKLRGSITAAKSNKLVANREGGIVCAAYSDGNFVYYCIINGENLEAARKFLKRGDYAFCECRHNAEGEYDAVYFYTDGGKLFMHAIPCYSAFTPYREIIDEGVTSISAAYSDCPLGCMLYYLKGGNVYSVNIKKENGKLIPCAMGIAASSALADKVSGIEDAENACCFVLTDKKGQNTLHIYKGDFADCGLDTVNADIVAYIEVL